MINFQAKCFLSVALIAVSIHVTKAYNCSDGCEIYDTFVDDDFCDCWDCGDEPSWDCDSCGGCPTECDSWVYCNVSWTGVDSNYTTTSSNAFLCDDGCEIHQLFENDDWCDCSNCEDETDWDCDSCGGCPSTCGSWVSCSASTEAPVIFTSTDSPNNFTCDDNCSVPHYWVNDDWCDCSNCEDEYETGWNCNTCTCPTECNDYHYCGSTNTGV